MPVPVRIDFVPPADPDIVELRIYESVDQDGPFNLIETVSTIGDYPDYISTYTTTFATADDYWFAIDWYDDKGGNLGLSPSIQGSKQLLLGEIVQRVQIRDGSINENIIYDEAEAVIETYFPGQVVREIEVSETTANERSGLTLLTQARCYLFDLSEGEQQYTAGLVSQKTKNSRSLAGVKELLNLAGSILGLSSSVIMQMAEIEIASGAALTSPDQSRLLLVEIL